MKKLSIILFAASLLLCQATFAQCVINTSDTINGITPDNPSDTVTRGVPYSQTLQVHIPLSGDGTFVDSVHISSITGAPVGLNYVFNPASATILGGGNAAICYTGTTNDTVGTYPLVFNGTVYVKIAGNPTSFPLGSSSLFVYAFYVKPAPPAPVAAFTGSLQTCVGSTVIFTDQSTGNPTGLSWTFAGGSPHTSTASNPNVTYNDTGTFTIKLVATNGGGSDSITKTIHVSPDPSSTVIVHPVNGSNNGSIVVIATGGTAPYNYTWSSNGTNTDSIGHLGTGTYYVTITDHNGCQTIDTAIVTQGAPTASFSGIPYACTNIAVPFTDESSNGPTAWHWIFQGGTPSTSNAENPTVSYSDTGLFTITLIASNAGGADTTTDTIRIFSSPLTTVDINPLSGSGASNGSAVVTATGGTAPYSYLWSLGGNTTDSLTHLTAGTYYVTITDSKGCRVVDTVVISVAAPEASFLGDSVACSNTLISFIDQSTNTPTAWHWTFTGGTPSTFSGPFPTVSYANPGNYTVKLVVSNDGGSDTITKSIHVLDSPEGTVAVNPVTGAPNATNGSAIETATGGTGPYTYVWSLNGNTSDTLNNIGQGTYFVTVTDHNGCKTIDTAFITFEGIIANFTSDSVGCINAPVTYTDASINSPSSWHWTFEGGSPSTSTSTTPSVTYSSTGIYHIKLVVSNSGSIDSITKTIHITANPSATTTSYPASGSAIVVASGGTAPYSYLWSGGGSTSDTLHNVAGGTYYVTITDHNGCKALDSATITFLTPEANFTGNSGGCVNTPVNYHDASVNTPTEWHWTFQGGSPATATTANPSVTYADTGFYSIKLVVKNESGIDSITKIIHIDQNPSATIVVNQVTGNSGANNGSAIVTASGGTGPYSYTWTAGVSTTDSLTNVGGGTYFVTVTDQNGCKAVDTAIITFAGPTGAFSGDASACTHASLTFTDESTNSPTSWLWIFEGGTPPTATTPTASVTYSSAGNFTVMLVVGNSGGVDTVTKTVHINESPSATVTTHSPSGNGGATNGSAAVLVTGGTPPYSYSWTANGSTTDSIDHVSEGTYYVTITDDNGCQIKDTAIITFTVPGAAFSGDTSTCAHNSITFTDQSTNAPTSRHWTFAGGVPPNSTSATPTITYFNSGTYTAKLVVTNSGGSDSTTKTIHVNVNPSGTVVTTPATGSPGATNGSAIVTASGGNAPYSYTWTAGSSTNDSLNNMAEGTYYVTITDHNGCQSVDTAVITFINGIEQLNGAMQVKIYPNPATDVLNLVWSQKSNAEIAVIDLNGNVTGTMITTGAMENVYDIHTLAPGTYILRITDKTSHQQQSMLFTKF